MIMEQRRFTGNNHWYHETQTSLPAQRAPLVPEAATIEDRFLLGLAQQVEGDLIPTLQQVQPALLASRDLYQILFPKELATSLTHTLTLYDRLSSALTVAQVTGVQRLCNHYAARLNPLPGPDSSRESNRRLTQITEYARQLASQPTLIDAAAVQHLDDVGLSASDIVTLSQIIGFVSYQARVVAGIHALMALPVPAAARDALRRDRSVRGPELLSADSRAGSRCLAVRARRQNAVRLGEPAAGTV